MSAMTNIFDADLAAAEAELPVSFIWMGKTLSGSRDATTDSQALADAGIIQLYDFPLLVRTALFGATPFPAKNDEIQIQDPKTLQFNPFRIDKITQSQDGVSLLLGCVQQN